MNVNVHCCLWGIRPSELSRELFLKPLRKGDLSRKNKQIHSNRRVLGVGKYREFNSLRLRGIRKHSREVVEDFESLLKLYYISKSESWIQCMIQLSYFYQDEPSITVLDMSRSNLMQIETKSRWKAASLGRA